MVFKLKLFSNPYILRHPPQLCLNLSPVSYHKNYRENRIHCSSSHAKGTAFEHQAIHYLPKICPYFSLVHVGGKGDKGIDFRGLLQFSNYHIPLIGQCKSHSRLMSPEHLRGFLGVLNGCNCDLPIEKKVLGVFVSATGYTEASKICALNYPSPILLLSLKIGTADPRFSLCFPNIMAQRHWPTLKVSESYAGNKRYLNLKFD